MTRTVFCRKYQKELPGLDALPMPGSVGQDIFEHVSAQAWQEWQNIQTMLINEHQLVMRDASARVFLQEQRSKFFNNADYEQPAGYVPPEDASKA